MIILGIDPGLANTGWGVVEANGNRFRCLAYGCISTPSGRAARAAPLGASTTSLRSVIREHAPAECAVEKLLLQRQRRAPRSRPVRRAASRFSPRPRRVSRWASTGPSEIKQAVVGYGARRQAQVQYMVRTILGLAEVPKPDHAADALAVAICHANSRGRQRLVESAR